MVAGDNLFSEPLADFAGSAKTSEATLATYDVGDLEAIKKYSSITIDSEGHHPVRREAGQAGKYAGRNRALLFFP